MAKHRFSNGDIKVLYEKSENIEEIVKEIKDKLDEHIAWGVKAQTANEHRFGELEERTQNLKYFVFGSIILAIGGLGSALISLLA